MSEFVHVSEIMPDPETGWVKRKPSSVQVLASRFPALTTCGREDCCPLEQTRGQLGPGDYYDVIANNAPGANSGRVVDAGKYGVPVRDGQDIGDHKQEHCVEMNDAISGDFRICCKTCGKTTPWGAQDIPGMPGAGADWTRKRWNESVS